jgi:hypothetical protein
MTPYESDDLTEVIEADGDKFVVLRSSETAGDQPDYRELGRFSTCAEAEAFLSASRPGVYVEEE